VDYEIGYQFVHKGPHGWLTGLVVGHDFTPKLEIDMELYSQGTFHPSENQPTIDFGARYKIHRPLIFLLMAGRSFEPTRSNQSYFLGYFGIQFLLLQVLKIRLTSLLPFGSESTRHEVLIDLIWNRRENGKSLPQSSVHSLQVTRVPFHRLLQVQSTRPISPRFSLP